MSFNFNTPVVCKTLNTGESQVLGAFNLVDSYSGILELKHIVVGANLVNMPTVNQFARLELHLDITGNSKIAESDLFHFSQIENIATSWNGLIRFDFANIPLNLSVNYYPKFVPVSYTRAIGSYMGLTFDWPITHTTIVDDNPLNHPIRMGAYFYSREQ
jgi:hypothetical protein